MPIPERKKAKSTPNEVATVVARSMALVEGILTTPMAALGPKVTAEKILEACIPPFDKEVDKLELDRIVSKLFHILS